MEKYNVKCEEENRHSAIGDAIATAEVFIKILNILKDKLKYIEDFYHNRLILKV
jgi:DNA polymerase III epsilon subunit-like protein